MKKRFISVMLSAAMLVTASPGMIAMAESGSQPWVLFEQDFRESFDAGISNYRIVNTTQLLSQNDADGNIFGSWDVGTDDFAPTLSTADPGILNVGWCGGRKPTIMLKNALPIQAGHDIVIDARVKYTAGNSYKHEDGISIGDGNNPLFNIMGTGANNYTKGALISQPGNSSTFISAGGGGSDVVSDVHLKNETWYDFNIIIEGNSGKFTYSVSEDNGNVYTSPTLSMYSGISDIRYIQLAYGAFTGTAVDHIIIYDEAELGNVEVVSGVNDEPLDGQNALPSDFTATLLFDRAVTNDDLAAITVSNDAEFTVKAIDDTFAEISFTGLKSATTYSIHIPMAGGNKTTDVSFTTAAPDWVLFTESFDAEKSTYKMVDTKKLLGSLDSDNNIFGDYTNAALSGGMLNIPRGGNVKPTVMLMDPVAVDGDKELVIETKVRYTAKNEKKTGDGTLLIGDGNNPIFNIMGTGADNYTRGIYVTLDSNGKVEAGNGGDQEVSDITLIDQTWYTFTFVLSSDGKNFSYKVSDEEGLLYESGKLNVYSPYSPLSNIRYIQLPYGDFAATNVDYINISKMGSVNIVNSDNDEVLDGQIDVSADAKAALFFDNPVTAEELNRITVDNDAQFEISLIDSFTAEISFTALENNTSYTISVPMIGGNAPTTANFRTEAPQWILFSDEFDSASPAYRIVNTKKILSENDADENIFGSWDIGSDDFAPTLSGGTLNVGWCGDRKPTLMIKKTVPTGRDLLIEMRVKYKAQAANKHDDGTILITNNNNPLFNIMGKGANNYTNGIMITQDAEGRLSAGNGGDQEVSDVYLTDQTWYNIAIKLSSTGKTFTLAVSDDNGNKYQSGTLNCTSTLSDVRYLQLAYGGFTNTYIDYLHITNASLIPVPEATFGEYNDSLDGAGNVHPGELVTISSKSELDAESISLDGEPATVELSADAKTATLAIPALEPRTMHILAVDDTQFSFRAADEPRYMYRAEFDGNDDDTVWYRSLNANKYSVENTSANVSDGVYTYKCDGDDMYRAFMPIFAETSNQSFITKAPRPSQKLDCTGKKNVVIETRFKLGEGTVDRQFMYVGNNIALLDVDENRVLRYNADPGLMGTPFKVYDDDFVLEPDRWYSLIMRFDFVSQRYQISVDDGNGNIANSGVLEFIYNHKKYEITDFRFARMLNKTDAPLSIDYFRIIDADYGKVDVTYGDGIPLEGSALIKDGDVFSFTSLNTPKALDSITLVDENGNVLPVDAEADGNDVSLFPAGFEYNTKYTLTIPAAVIGADSDQIVKFRTAYDKDAAFVYPEGYSSEDELNVVYFGGSITNQEGWRVYSTNWFKEHFPNAHCYNASIGGTGAEYGWIRLNRDVISKDPDIVFVEYAVNDSANSATAKYMESIVRNLNALEKPPVIIFVYTTVLNFDTNTYAMAEHERVAKAYGIPSISIHDYVQSLYNTDPQFAKDWDEKNYLPDSTHPSTSGETNGSKVYGEYVNAVLTSDCAKYFVKPSKNSKVTPLTEYKDYVYDYDNVDLTLTEPGESFEYDFEGDELIVDCMRNSNGGRFKLEVDGNVVVESADTYVVSGPPMPVRAEGLGDGSHKAVITVLNDATGSSHNVKINSILTKGSGINDSALEFGNIVFDSQSVSAGTPITASVKYVGNESVPVIMTIALYDSKGTFTGFTMVSSTTDPSGEERTLSVTVTPKEGDTTAKAFVWDDLETAMPLTEAASIGE